MNDKQPSTDTLLLPLEPYFSVVTLTEQDFKRQKSKLRPAFSIEESDQDLDLHHKELVENSDGVFSQEEDHSFYVDTDNGYLVFEDSDSRNAEKNVQHYLYAINKDLALIRYFKMTSSGWIFAERSNKDMHSCLGFPVFSPDSTGILAVSSSIPQKDDEMGFQFFRKENNKWTLKWKIHLKEWFADELHWLNDSSVICRKVYFDPMPLKKNYDSIQYLQLTFKKW